MRQFVRNFVILILCLLSVSAARAGNNFPGTTLSGSSGSISSTTVGMTGETGEPNFTGGATTSVWYSWTAPSSGYFTIGTCNITGDTAPNRTVTDTTLAAYTGTAVNALGAAIQAVDDSTSCNSDANVNYGSTLGFNVTSGTTYRFQVDTYSSSTQGTYILRWGLAALTINVTDSSATEGGDTASFTIVPTSPPPSTAVDNLQVNIGTSTQCTFSSSTLIFTKANWTTPQTVTVTATNDTDREGVHSCGTFTIGTTDYGGVTATSPTIAVNDNDTGTFTINKTVGSSSIAAPGTLSYTITVQNTGTGNLTSPVLTDAITLGVTSLTLTSGPTLSSGDTNSDGKVSVGETWTYLATYAVTQANLDTGGTISNIATFSATAVTTASSPAATTTLTQTPNFTITKTQSSGPSSITAAAQVIGYSISVQNTGNISLTGMSLTDTFQLGGVARTLTSGPSFSSGDTNSDGKISVGETWVYTASYTVPQSDIDGTGSFTNQATMTTTQVAAKSSGTVTTNVTRSPSFTNVKTLFSGPSPVTAAGQTLTYRITIANTGNQTLTGLTISDALVLGVASRTLTSGPTYTSGDTDSDGTIDTTETWIYAATYLTTQADLDATGDFSNTATFDTTQTAPLTSAAVTTNVTRSPSFTNVKTLFSGPSPVTAAGQTLTYRVTIANTGNQTLTGLTISDTLLLDVASRTLTSGPTYTSGDTDGDGAIDTTETWIYTATYLTTQADLDATGNFSNTATFDTTQTAPLTSAAVTTNVTRSPSFTNVKTLFSGPSPVTAAGQTLTYRVTIANTGNQTLTGLTISDTLLLGASSRTLTSGPTYTSGDTDADGAIDTTETWNYTATYLTTQADMDGTGNYSNTATYDTTQTAPLTSAAVTTNVTRTASFTNVKTQSSGPSPVTAAGQAIGYAITIANTGNQTLTGLTISDALVLGVSSRTLTSGPSYSSGDTDSDGAIDVGETWVYSASYTTTQTDFDATGNFSNTATFDTTQTAPLTSSAVTTNVTRSPSFTNVKTQSSGPNPVTAAGQAIGYSITIANTGNQTLTGPTISDALLLGASSRTLTSGPTYFSGDTDSDSAIDVGETWVYSASYTTAQADFDATGNFANTATFDTTQTSPLTSAAVTTNVTRSPSFTNVKTLFSGPSPITAAGQTLTYRITIANTGNQSLTGLTISDALLLGAASRTLTSGPTYTSGDMDNDGAIDTTETWIYTATYLTTQTDLDATGNFANSATYDTAQTAALTSNTVTTNVTRTSSLTVDKSFTFTTDAFSNNLADLNDVVQYSYLVTNTGNVTITNLSVSDIHNGAGSLGTINPSSVSSLGPGISTTFTASYTVIQGDIDAP